MKKIFTGFSFITLSIAAFYCVGLLLFFFSFQAKGLKPTVSSSEKSTATVSLESTEAAVSSAPATVSSIGSNSVQAATPTEALGKILSKNITAASANVFYNRVAIKNTTGKTVNIPALLSVESSLKINKKAGPNVLIVHTHTSESYLQEERDYYTKNDATRTTDNSKNVVAVGQVLKQTLEASGVGVVHATEKHDYPEYNGSYNRAAATIQKYLKQYPSIQVVIDLHRDSVSGEKTKTALVQEINGQKAAQIMLVCGCQEGEVSGFENWEKNLQLSAKIQQTAEVLFPGLMRPILLTARRYNLHLTPGSLLLEFGTEANTLTQAKYSAVLMGKALVSVLNQLSS